MYFAEERRERNMPTETRPWGHFTNLYDTDFTKVKTITVLPKQRLSLQSHKKRQEQWIIVRGRALVELDDQSMLLEPGQTVFIPTGAKHRLSNPEEIDLEIVEVQTGSYFGEDDIIRYEDDYKRA